MGAIEQWLRLLSDQQQLEGRRASKTWRCAGPQPVLPPESVHTIALGNVAVARAILSFVAHLLIEGGLEYNSDFSCLVLSRD